LAILKEGRFGYPRDSAKGEFEWKKHNKFCGYVMTPTYGEDFGTPAEKSSVYFYMGVLIDTVYSVISPAIEDVPELTCGFAIWHPASFQQSEKEAVRGICTKLNGVNEASTPWCTGGRSANNDNCEVTLIYRSLKFLSAYKPELDWRELARAFYRTSLADIEKAAIGKEISIAAELNH
tara:strand:+ start:88 stop:621 length:534 start_codon:yes stop_codon:yes gene_type:complete